MAKGLSYLLGLLLLAAADTSWGQKAPNWRGYKAATGLPSPVCSSVTIAPHGKVLVTHPGISNITELDGYSVNRFPAPSPLKNRVYESPAGQLWTVVPEGLLDFKNGAWTLHVVRDIVAESKGGPFRSPDPVPLCPVRQGLVLFLLPDRLAELDCPDASHSRTIVLRLARQTQLGSFTGLCPARGDGGEGGLWVGGARGLAKAPGPTRNLKPASEWREYPFPAPQQIQDLRELHEDKNGNITAIAESTQTHQKVIVHFNGQQWTIDPATAEKLRFAWRGPDGTCWAANPNTLFQYQPGATEMTEYEDITARAYNDLAIEPGGSFWLATSDGLYRYAALAWRSPAAAQKINTPIRCLTMDNDGRLWFISGNLLHSIHGDHHEEFSFPAGNGRRFQAARALVPLKNGTLLLNAAGQLARFEPASTNFCLLPAKESGALCKVLGTLKDGAVCVQTSVPAGTNQSCHLEISSDGTSFTPFSDAPPQEIFGGDLTVLFAAQNGDVWLSGEQGTAWFHDSKWRVFFSTDQTTPRAALGFAEVGDGRAWCATEDRIWEFDGRNWTVVRGGFEPVNGMVRTRDGSVWTAASSGLYRYIPAHNAWVEAGTEEGLPSADIREVFEDRSGRLWAGTGRGLSFYDPEADRDPPLTRIRELTETGRKVREGGTIALSFNMSQDKWNYTLPARLLFSYQLDTNEWTRFSEETSESFPDLPPGMHYLSVRAMDRNGNIEAKVARYEFEVVLPWYKETRLLLIALAGMAGALFFAGLAFNRHQRLLHSYAEVEKKVAERTRELEIAHLELVHSQKMTALGTLAAGIAHDFNNILSIIQGSAQIIEDNLENAQKVRTRVDRIKTVVEQGAGIVKAMLGFSRDSGQVSAQCDINAVVENTIKLLGDRFLREVQVTFDPAPSLPTLAAPKDFIQQMLLNFIFNAAESMNGRKRIILATGLVDKLPANLVLAPAKAETYVTIAVRDFGCGIPPANLPRIFEPFFTTKALSARRGTGLGLSMVYQLAGKMEAGLTVESALDKGSTFTLILAARTSTPTQRPETS